VRTVTARVASRLISLAQGRRLLSVHVQQIVPALVVCCCVLVTGVVAGAVCVRRGSEPALASACAPVDSLLAANRAGCEDETGRPVTTGLVFQTSARRNLLTLGIVWGCGALLAGWAALPVVFSRGFALGYTVGLLAWRYGWAACAVSFLSVFPQALLAIPVLTLLPASALGLLLEFIGGRALRGRRGLPAAVVCHTALCLAAVPALLLVSMLDAVIAPAFLRLLAPYLLSTF